MRKYPTDSPEAAARMVALAMMADGTIDRHELFWLEQQQVARQLGLENEQFDSIYYDYCTDMLSCAYRHHSGQLQLDEAKIKKMLREIRDPELQNKTLKIMLDIVNADDQLSQGEAALIALALKQWSIDLTEISISAIPIDVLPQDLPVSTVLPTTSTHGGLHHASTG